MINILQHLDVWTSAIETRSTAGRGSSNKLNLYGIKKLRELILELAVRGQLVPQNPDDEPASQLLEKIAAEKARLIKDGKLKKQEPLPPITDDEKPFELPEGWKWLRLGNIGYTQTGGTPKAANPKFFGSDIPFIKPGDIYPSYVDYMNEGLSNAGKVELGRVAPNGSVLMVCIGTIGKCALIKQDCCFNQQINSITPTINIGEYLLYVLSSNYFQNQAWSRSSSTTIAILNKGKWENIAVPIPPLAEQHRIVAKVNELMSLCDTLEQEQTTNIAAHQTLVEELLAALTQKTPSPQPLSREAGEGLREDRDTSCSPSTASRERGLGGEGLSWQCIATHFDTLFTTEHSIDQLKQTILQLAVMGKLVPQDPNDEPASVLLQKIAAEKALLIKEGKIKKEKPLPAITEDEKPFELPDGWEWSKCQDICHKITDGEHATPKRTEAGNYLLSARNVTNEGILLHDVDFVPDDEFERIRRRCDPNIGDVLISCSGSVGRVALVDQDGMYAMVRSAAMIRPSSIGFSLHYLVNLLRSPFLQSQMKEKSKQSAQANLFLGAISSLVFAIPPLAEQHRIVAKVDELMALCDAMKAQLRTAQTTQLQLADVLASQIIGAGDV